MRHNPILHEGVQVIGCDCGGCYGEIDTPYVAMTRGTYESLMHDAYIYVSLPGWIQKLQIKWNGKA